MAEAREMLTKLTPFDRSVLSLLGMAAVLSLAALLNAPFGGAAIVGLLYVTGVQLYGRLPRPRDPRAEALSPQQETAGLLDPRAIADNLSEAVWIINAREEIIYANAMAASLFGETPYGHRLAAVLRDPSVLRLVKTVLSGEAAAPVEYHRSTPVDRHLRVTATDLNISRPDEPPRRFAMLVFTNITDLVKFAATQSDFLANASHELKTPIASLLGYIETLRGHAKDDPIAREKFLAIMQGQAERMQRLISDLLSLRQIEQSEHIAPSASADICAALNVALDTVSPLAKTRGVELVFNGPSALSVRGVQDELVQLCLNIIDNAVKMTPKAGQVRLTVAPTHTWRAQDFFSGAAGQRQIVTPAPHQQGYAIITFEDDGPGFAPTHIPRLGERFYRIAGDRSSKDKGTGLGLAIVKHIVRRHRGGLFIKSRRADSPAQDGSGTQPSGTCFTVLLPLIQA